MQKAFPVFSFVPFLGMIALSPFPSLGSEASRSAVPVQIDGRLDLGLQTDSDPNHSLENQFGFGLQLSSDRVQGFAGVAEISADENSRQVSVRDAFVDFVNEEKTKRIRFGRGKKILGWEREYPTSARLTLHRSVADDYLAERGLTGRDYFISYTYLVHQKEKLEDPLSFRLLTDSAYQNPFALIDAGEDWKFDLSLHLTEVKDSSAVLSVLHNFGPAFRFGTWLSGTREQSVTQVFCLWQVGIGALFQNQTQRAELEFQTGVDPYQSDISLNYGDRSRTHFLSVRAEYGQLLNRFNPYAEGALVYRNLSDKAERNAEALLGIRYYLRPSLSLALEEQLRTVLSGGDASSEPYRATRSEILARYFY